MLDIDTHNINNIHDYLADIAENIQIQSDFEIYHPNFQPFTLPSKIVDRLKKTSLELQNKYLQLLLRNFIYGIYFSGCLKNNFLANNRPKNYLPYQNIENNLIIGIDWQFHKNLHSCNHGVGYFDPGWQVLRLEPDGSIAVSKDGLHLHVEPDWLIESAWQYPKVGQTIAIWMDNHRLENGFYVGVSNAGAEKSSQPDGDLVGGRIYFNITPEGAIALMDSLTIHLNNAGIPFRFQVLYNPAAYQRYNSGLLCFACRDYPGIIKVLKAVYPENQSHFRPEIPLFTKFLAPGLSFAEEPNQQNPPPESFGIHRCQIIANGLLDAWERGKKSSEAKIRIIRQHFAHLGIDWQYPYLNPHSQDIYHSLNDSDFELR
ncbi:MAG: T3SS effector HopA1 family protein [Calothrix sp. MO_192.B10]|nr:T3SS effector HopA1 family protein [Calothrix sp. MO_192.B10]